ncbi:MAG: Hsp20/alpha crystallin family protein [Cyanobacteriota bacterium]|nr:Hsp20/alpha crystallin family protein [Cyanobacteriota bacterium]
MIITNHRSFQDLETVDCQVAQVFNEAEFLGSGDSQLPVIKTQVTQEEITIKALLPNLEEKSLEIQVTEESIVLSGHLYSTQNNTQYKKFRQVIALPQPVLCGNIKSTYVNGILTLVLCKAGESFSSSET